jgi:RNA polymerase primary sigma factor
MSHPAQPLDHGRVKRIVRLMLAHVIDGTISSRDVDNVFHLVRALHVERDAVLRALPEVGVRIATDRPDSFPETEDIPQLETAPTRELMRPAITRTVLEEDVEAARRVLRSDHTRRNPSNRVLTAQEEVGLSVLMRGPDLPLDRELPEGYRSDLEPEDERARAFDALMVHNMRLVWSIARTQDASGLDLEDVVQHGMLGLRRAVEKFDATQGYKFSTYATWWIRQSITRGIANEGRLIRIPVHMLEQVNKVLAVRNRILSESGTCKLSRLTSETGLSAEKVIECLRLAVGVVSLDKQVEEEGESLGDFVLTLPADEADPAQLIDQLALRQLVRDALGDLTPREAMVLSLREGLDTDAPLTLDEIGKMLGLTRERIRQIQGKARGKLRVALTDRGLGPLRPAHIAAADDSANDDARAATDSEAECPKA